MLNSTSIISLVSSFINDADLLDDENKLEKAKNCLELILQEIASEYCGCVYQEKVNIESNECLLFSNLTKTLLSIKSVRKDGKNVPFKAYPDCLSVSEGGEYMICYNYMPTIDLTSEEISGFSPMVSNRVVAYGVAAEYLLNEGRYEEANLWDSRYKDGLQAITRKSSTMVMKRRAWF